ncbi:hypothetical protein Fmac_019404 [Flemingia macrophylla]|uniref:Uncharacterized protein n=1 Tax=Flemingia macrophylla TaxID=520843 RepID=A0ABD1M7R0_9FABA
MSNSRIVHDFIAHENLWMRGFNSLTFWARNMQYLNSRWMLKFSWLRNMQ